jgi:hypothetical protein
MGDRAVGELIKNRWKKESRGVSLKQFARELLKKGDELAKRWFANKKGACNQKRSEANVKLTDLVRTATYNARRATKKK